MSDIVQELPIIHVDDDLIVLDKPSGLLSVPGLGVENADCLSVRVQSVYPDAKIVHRLDRDTSGLIIMALTGEAQRHVHIQFQKREVDKVYTAIVAGCVEEDEGEINLPMRKDMRYSRPPRHLIDIKQGKSAITRYRVVERLGDRTRLLLYPETGRSHQLRVHMLTMGHVILGDDIYADEINLNKAERLQLHATSIRFRHPRGGDWLDFECPAPF